MPLPNGATLPIASSVPGATDAAIGATRGPADSSFPSGSSSSSSSQPTSSLATSSPAGGPESGQKRMCLSDLDGLSAAEKEEGWRHLTQSAKRKARKMNYEGWWNEKEKKDEKDDLKEKVIEVPDDMNNNSDSWGPKWPGPGPPKPDGGGLAA